MLLRHYGGVPLIGDNIYEIDDEMKTSRDTYADCVEYIVSECKQAARDLPNKFRGINTGRATAGACNGLISDFVCMKLVNYLMVVTSEYLQVFQKN